MRTPPIVLSALLLTACVAEPPAGPKDAGQEPAPPVAPPPALSSAPKPKFELTETPDAELGTAPSGFGLKVGDKAPDAALPEISGQVIKLSDLYAQGPTLVVFYRGGWCPFCNLQLHELSAKKAEFDARRVKLVAISVDKPSEEAKTQAAHGVPFPMLSDSKLVAHQAFHVVHVPGEAEKKALAGHKIDLAAYAGEAHGSFAVPAVFLVDGTGKVRFVHVGDDYKTRPSARQLLAMVDRILAKP